MKTILMLIFTLLIAKVTAQTSAYYPFPDSNAVWTEQAQSCCANDCPPPPTPNPVLVDYNFSYYLLGDTIINSISYHKIYQSGYIHEYCSFGNYLNNWGTLNSYIGAFRQDNILKKVFFIYPTTIQESLLYDFNLNVGDTLNTLNVGSQNGCPVITSIDSVLIGNGYRKRFNLSTVPSYSIIEGIGSTSGLLEPLCPFEYFGTLICFSQNGQTLYPDTITVCAITTHLNKIEKHFSFTITPNPFHTSATLQTNEQFANSELIIYNILGKKVKQQIIQDKTSIINRDGFDDGIYFLQAINNKGQIMTGKIIVEKK